MANRSDSKQSAHDEAVERYARQHENDGWDVSADVTGYSNPPTLGKGGRGQGRIPDIYAEKRGNTRIIEVETSRSDDDRQHEVFENHAKQFENTVAKVILVGSDSYKRDEWEL